MKVVLACGCFDLLHYGHVAHLKAARQLGDHLIVALTADEAINKGPGRPVFNWARRAEMLAELRCVDRVIRSTSAAEAIIAIKPEIYVKGAEYRGRLPEQATVEAYGGQVIFTDTEVWSSTALIQHIRVAA